MYIICMKRINITLSDEVAARVEKLAESKEMSVAEITRRSLEIYLQKFPEKTQTHSHIPSFNLGKPRRKDLKQEIYSSRVKALAR